MPAQSATKKAVLMEVKRSTRRTRSARIHAPKHTLGEHDCKAYTGYIGRAENSGMSKCEYLHMRQLMLTGIPLTHRQTIQRRGQTGHTWYEQQRSTMREIKSSIFCASGVQRNKNNSNQIVDTDTQEIRSLILGQVKHSRNNRKHCKHGHAEEGQ